MADVFVEARPKGQREGTPIIGYVVVDHGDRTLITFPTQQAAISWAKASGHTPHVAKVRHLNDKTKPGYWKRV